MYVLTVNLYFSSLHALHELCGSLLWLFLIKISGKQGFLYSVNRNFEKPYDFILIPTIQYYGILF